MEKSFKERLLWFFGLHREQRTTKTIATVAMLVAFAILLKAFGSIETGIWRLSFYEIPLIILGIFFGPFYALVGGFATDFGYIMSRGWMYGFNLFTVATILWAVLPGLLLFRQKVTLPKVILVVAVTSLSAFIFNTLGLVQFYGTTQLIFFENGVPGPLFPRIVTSLVKFPVQVSLVYVVVTRLQMAFPYLREQEAY